jgi:hypothetical protein
MTSSHFRCKQLPIKTYQKANTFYKKYIFNYKKLLEQCCINSVFVDVCDVQAVSATRQLLLTQPRCPCAYPVRILFLNAIIIS